MKLLEAKLDAEKYRALLMATLQYKAVLSDRVFEIGFDSTKDELDMVARYLIGQLEIMESIVEDVANETP